MTQEERKRRSRQEICRVALEEFGTYGYEKTTMERICTRHNISKGMMYHYFANRDQLYLHCVERTFGDLKVYLEQAVEREMVQSARKNPVEAIQGYFLLRETYFRDRPLEKGIFEEVLFRPPKHLLEQIGALRAPVRAVNVRFLLWLMDQSRLRPGLTRDRAARYLEGMESVFRVAADNWSCTGAHPDLHTLLAQAGELADLILFGVLRQPPEPALPAEEAPAPDAGTIKEDKEQEPIC